MFAEHETQILDSFRGAGSRQQTVKLGLLGLGHEIAGHQQTQRQQRAALPQLLIRQVQTRHCVKQSFLARAMRQVEHPDDVRVAFRRERFGCRQRLAGPELFAGGEARLAERKHLPRKIGARIRDAIADHPDLAREKFLGIRAVVARQHDAQIHLFHEMIRERAGTHQHHCLKPLRQPGGVPVQNYALKKTPADQHHEPVTIQRRPFAGGGDVIKGGHSMAEAAPDGLRAIAQEQEKLSDSQIPNILELLRQPGIDVITVNAERAEAGGAGPGACSTAGLAPVPAKAFQHELHHVALAVVGGWRVGENEQFHSTG